MKRTAYPAAVWVTVIVAAVGLLALAAPFSGSPSALATEARATASSSFLVSAAGKVLPPATGAYAGVTRYSETETLDSYVRVTTKSPAIVMWFQQWAEGYARSFDVTACNEVIARGAIPLISWEPWDPRDPAKTASQYRLIDIIEGDHDAYIRQWAQEVQKVNGPVMLRPMHEMNGQWYPWNGTVNGNTPAQFIKAWQHIHDIFDAEGATNVTWVWSINCMSSPDDSANPNAVFSSYYPGDEYVDWTSVSGYNWGKSRLPWSKWRTFDRIYAQSLAYLKPLNKPILISEFASVSTGGDKAAWLAESYARIMEIPEIKGVVYYDRREYQAGEQDWEASSTWQSWRAYRRIMTGSYYQSGLLGAHPGSTLGIPAP